MLNKKISDSSITVPIVQITFILIVGLSHNFTGSFQTYCLHWVIISGQLKFGNVL
jgi:hypothetical protein